MLNLNPNLTVTLKKAYEKRADDFSFSVLFSLT